MCYITFFIVYRLALAFIGVSLSLKKTLLPVLTTSVIGYISKICFGASASVQTAVVVITCAVVLYLFNQTSLLLSLIGPLLAIITLTLGSMVLACPVYIKLGYEIPSKTYEPSWLLLNLLELIVPVIVLVILKIGNFSLNKYLYNNGDI